MATNLRVATSLFLLASALCAQQAAFTNSGGTITLGTDLVMTGSTVASPAGSYFPRLPCHCASAGHLSGGVDLYRRYDHHPVE
jgi:hypothetical protein